MARHLAPSDLDPLFDRLERTDADGLESETLEIKTAPPDLRKLRDLCVETAVCFANAAGGSLVVGVQDRVKGRARAVVGLSEPPDVNALKRAVYDATDPHILVEIETVRVREGDVLLMTVPRGLPPHSTTSGRAWIRLGASCVPLTGSMMARLLASSGGADLSAEVLDGTGLVDLDPAAVAEARRLLDGAGRLRGRAARDDEALLTLLGLPLHDGSLTMAALLLLGTDRSLRRHVPQHEVTMLSFRRATRYDDRLDLRSSLLTLLPAADRFLQGALRLRTIRPAGFAQLEVREITEEVAREAVLNAVTHRDYVQRQGVLVEVRGDRVQITNPGGFVGGITAENVLRHPHVHRNEQLAQALQQLGLVNRAGIGVDRIYEGLLRLGNETPSYVAVPEQVSLALPRSGSDEFAAWVLEQESRGEELDLDELIVLRRLVDVASIDRWSAQRYLQVDDAAAAARLADMRRRGLLVVSGRGRAAQYALPRTLSERLRGRALTDADRPLEAEGVRLRVLALLEDRDRLTNGEIRRISGWSRAQVHALLSQLAAEGRIERRGAGRGAHVVPARSSAYTSASDPTKR